MTSALHPDNTEIAEPLAEEERKAPEYGDPVKVGPLLSETDDKKVCKLLHEDWAAQASKYARRICEAEVNARRRQGEGNIWVEKVQDQNQYRVYVAHGATRYSQFYQKANRLCLRFISYLYPDPAKPEAIPSTGEAEDRDAAEFATRVLADIGSESGLNDLDAHKQAQDLACNWGSAYVWYFTDPQGGGRQPIEVQAHPAAPHVDQATLDPETRKEYKGETVTRYVRPDGSLTDQKGEAALRWTPKITRQVCDMGSVRLHPQTATDLWDATGLTYAAYHTWGTLKGWFPALQEATNEQRDRAIKFRLRECEHLLPKRGWKAHDPKLKEGQEDQALALLMIRWETESADYPDGCYVVTVGDELVPHRGEWLIETPARERRDLPFTQVNQWRENGLMDFLGPSNEMRGEIYGRSLDMLDRLLNRKILLPMGSTLQPGDFQNPFATTLHFQPGYEPKYEEVASIPGEAFKMVELTDADMDDASALQQTGRGLQVPGVTSGRQALAIVSQVQAGLSDVNQNANRAFVRGWRVQLQTIRADYQTPQLLRFVDQDGEYKAQRWLGSDLGSTRDVQVSRGSGTLLNPMQKIEMVMQYQQATQTPVEDIQDILSSGFSPYTAMQDNKHLQRVRRQIKQWEDGPPAEWQPPAPPTDPVTNQPVMVVGPMGPMPAPPPPDPVLAGIFDQRPVDVAPIVAKVRVRELGLAMATTKYAGFPPGWQQGLNAEYQRMVQALTPPAPPPGAPPAKAGAPPAEPNALQGGEAAVLGPSINQPAGARATG